MEGSTSGAFVYKHQFYWSAEQVGGGFFLLQTLGFNGESERFPRLKVAPL